MDSSDLRNQLDQAKEEGTPNDAEEEDSPEQSETADPEPAIEPAPDDESEQSDEDAESETLATTDDDTDDQEDAGGPAFTTQESDKISIYPHTDTSRLIKVLCNSVENDLLALGHDDFEVREAHDAMVRLANEHPREVTQLVLNARDLDPDAVEDLP